MNRLSTLLLFFFLPIYTLNGQDHIFDAQLLKTEDGLANLLTTSVVKDKNGYLWVATNYGLNRYDGYDFTLYTSEKNNLHSNDHIHKIQEDKQGNLWLFFSTTIGNIPNKNEQIEAIDIFNPQTGKAISFDTFFEEKVPFKVSDLNYSRSIDTQNRLWFTTKVGEVYLYEAGQFTKIYEQKNVAFQFLTVDEKDNIWLGNNKQLTKINLAGKILEKHTLSNKISGIWTDTQQQMWVATYFYKFTPSKTNQNIKDYTLIFNLWKREQDGSLTAFSLEKDGVLINQTSGNYFLHRSTEGYWYFLQNGQLQIFNSVGVHLFNYNEIIGTATQLNLTNYLEVDGNNLWFTTPIGLLRTTVNENPFRLMLQKDDYADSRGITADKAGNIYFIDEWIYRWNPNQAAPPEQLPVPGYFALTCIDSLLWTGVYGANLLGNQVNLRTKDFFSYDREGEAKFAYAILQTTTPKQLLLGTNKGLVYVNLQQEKQFPFTKYNEFEQLKNSEIYHIYQNEQGIWLATNQGVFLMNEEKGVIRAYNRKLGDLPFDFVRHIYQAPDGVYWLATKGGGIIQWQPSFLEGEPSIYRQFTIKEGLSNNYTYAIYGDEYGKLWIPSDRGLMCMDTATYEVNVFLKENGLPHNEFNLTSHYQAKDGTLYFGGLGGIIHFHPKVFENKSINDTPLRFVRYHLLEGDKEEVTDKTELLAHTNTITIKPTDKFFELAFALLDFENPSLHQYAYQIEGYSTQWNYIDENYVRIPSLPYGDYRLNVKGRNYGKDWSSQILSLDIKVIKPFYLETWFLLTTIIGLILLFISFVNWRLQSFKKDRERLEAEVQKRTKTIQLQAQELQALDKAKTRFFSNITHEFRTPLTLITGPIEQIIEMDLPTKSKTKLRSVLKNARHLLGLINQLLDLSKLESGQMKVELMHGDIIGYTQELVERIKPLADKKQQSFHFITQETIWKTQFDKKKWDKIIYNLLSNAIKYTPAEGTIQMELTTASLKESTCLHLMVKDSGIGIDEHQLSQIFNRFYQIDDSSTRDQEGTGIGLALVKELIEIQGGTIEATSELRQGTTFDVKIPIIESTSNRIEEDLAVPNSTLFTDLLTLETIDQPINSGIKDKTEESLEILIIEDNAELRAYIRDCIDNPKYHISEAANGIEGLEKTITTIPDLIISDVMMPGKNGFEVTAMIRKNKATSHIPIILLTAKAALESRLKGIEKGADAYLTKPFSPKELKMRVQKLIELRQLIRHSIQAPQSSEIKPIYQKENRFIQEVHLIILNNINSIDLNGEFIGQQIGMSRMQIHRKMKALVNQSAREMIKEMRLKKAYELLLTGNHNISEVAYQTGFNTLAYFSKIFKEEFGYAPSECLKKTSV